MKKIIIACIASLSLCGAAYAAGPISITQNPSSTTQFVQEGGVLQIAYTLQNTTPSSMAITNIGFAPASTLFTATDNSATACPPNLAPTGHSGSSCTVTVTLTAGDTSGTAPAQYLKLTAGAQTPVKSDSTAITVTPPPTAIWDMGVASGPTPSALILGDPKNNTTSVTYTVANTDAAGGPALAITSAQPGVTGTGLATPEIDSANSTCVAQYNSSLPAGQNCTYVVTAKANAVSTTGATISLSLDTNGNYNNTGSNSGSVSTTTPVTVTQGQLPTVSWGLSEGTADPAHVIMGQSNHDTTSVTYTVSNDATTGSTEQPLVITGATAALAAGSTGLTVTSTPVEGSCVTSNGYKELSVGQTCTYVVSATASNTGSTQVTGQVALTVNTQNGGAFNSGSVATTGTMNSSSVTVYPASLQTISWGMTFAAPTNVSLTLNDPKNNTTSVTYTVTNNATPNGTKQPLIITAATPSATGSLNLSTTPLSSTCTAGHGGYILEAGQPCTFTVSATAGSAGTGTIGLNVATQNGSYNDQAGVTSSGVISSANVTVTNPSLPTVDWSLSAGTPDPDRFVLDNKLTQQTTVTYTVTNMATTSDQPLIIATAMPTIVPRYSSILTSILIKDADSTCLSEYQKEQDGKTVVVLPEGATCTYVVTATPAVPGTASIALSVKTQNGQTLDQVKVSKPITVSSGQTGNWTLAAVTPVSSVTVGGETQYATFAIGNESETTPLAIVAPTNASIVSKGCSSCTFTLVTDPTQSTCFAHEDTKTGTLVLPASSTGPSSCTIQVGVTASSPGAGSFDLTVDALNGASTTSNTASNGPLVIKPASIEPSAWTVTVIAPYPTTVLAPSGTTTITYLVSNNSTTTSLRLDPKNEPVMSGELSEADVDSQSTCLGEGGLLPASTTPGTSTCTYIVDVTAADNAGTGSVAFTVNTVNGGSQAAPTENFSVQSFTVKGPASVNSAQIDQPLSLTYTVQNTSGSTLTLAGAQPTASQDEVKVKPDLSAGTCISGTQLDAGDTCTYVIDATGTATLSNVSVSLAVTGAVNGTMETESGTSGSFAVTSNPSEWTVQVVYSYGTTDWNVLPLGANGTLTYTIHNNTNDSLAFTSLIGSTPTASSSAVQVGAVTTSTPGCDGMVGPSSSCTYTASLKGVSLTGGQGVDIVLPITASGAGSQMAVLKGLPVTKPGLGMEIIKQPSSPVETDNNVSFSVKFNNFNTYAAGVLDYSIYVNGKEISSSGYKIISKSCGEDGQVPPRDETTNLPGTCTANIEVLPLNGAWPVSTTQQVKVQVYAVNVEPTKIYATAAPVNVESIPHDQKLLTVSGPDKSSGASLSMYPNMQQTLTYTVSNANDYDVTMDRLLITAVPNSIYAPLVVSNCVGTDTEKTPNRVPAKGSCKLFVTFGTTNISTSETKNLLFCLYAGGRQAAQSQEENCLLPGGIAWMLPLTVAPVPAQTTTLQYQNNCQQSIFLGVVGRPVDEGYTGAPPTCTSNSDCPSGASCLPDSATGNSICYWNTPLPTPTTVSLPGGESLLIPNYQIPSGQSLSITVPSTGTVTAPTTWAGVSVARFGCDPSNPTKDCEVNPCVLPKGLHQLPVFGVGGPENEPNAVTVANQYLACQALAHFGGPVTEANIALGSVTGQTRNPDQYNVSFVNGFNVPMSVQPTAANLPSGAYSANAPYTCGTAGSSSTQGSLGACQWNYQDNVLGNFAPSWPDAWNGVSGASAVGSYLTRVVQVGSKPVACTQTSNCSEGLTCGLSEEQIKTPTGAKGAPQLQCGTFAGYWSPGAVCNLNSTLGHPFNCGLSTGGGNTLGNWYQCLGTKSSQTSCYSASGAEAQNCCGCQDWGSYAGSDSNLPPILLPDVQTCNASTSYWQTNGLPIYAAFKSACPSAAAYRFDTASSQFSCTANNGGVAGQPMNYTVTFCPGGPAAKAG